MTKTTIKKAAEILGWTWTIRPSGTVINNPFNGYFGHIDDIAILDHMAASLARFARVEGWKVHIYDNSTILVTKDMQYTKIEGENATMNTIEACVKCLKDK